jgi:hypothetical protein
VWLDETLLVFDKGFLGLFWGALVWKSSRFIELFLGKLFTDFSLEKAPKKLPKSFNPAKPTLRNSIASQNPIKDPHKKSLLNK